VLWANLPEHSERSGTGVLDGLSKARLPIGLKEPLGSGETRMRSGIQRLRDLLETKVR